MTESKGQPFITPEQLLRETPDEAYARTSSDIPVKITIRGKDIFFRELPMTLAKAWEEKANAFFEEMAKLEDLADIDEDDAKDRKVAVSKMPILVQQMPEQIGALVVSYIAPACEDEDVTEEWLNANMSRSLAFYLAKAVFWIGLPTLRGEGLNGIMPSTVEKDRKQSARTPLKKV